MFEIILSSGNSAASGYYRNSGPGPKRLLSGSLELGFFGEVTSAELFNTVELQQSTEFLAFNPTLTYPTWLKFARNGKFLFFPMRPLGDVSWDHLYDAGLVYGLDANYPPGEANQNANTVNQMQVVVRGKDRFKVRLMKGDLTNPSLIVNGSQNAEQIKANTEWNDLLFHITDYSAVESRLPKFASYVNGVLTGATWTQEHGLTLSSPTRLIKSSTNLVQQSLQPSSSLSGWRPVLEVIDADVMVSQKILDYSTDLSLMSIGAFKGAGYKRLPAEDFLQPAMQVGQATLIFRQEEHSQLLEADDLVRLAAFSYHMGSSIWDFSLPVASVEILHNVYKQEEHVQKREEEPFYPLGGFESHNGTLLLSFLPVASVETVHQIYRQEEHAQKREAEPFYPLGGFVSHNGTLLLSFLPVAELKVQEDVRRQEDFYYQGGDFSSISTPRIQPTPVWENFYAPSSLHASVTIN